MIIFSIDIICISTFSINILWFIVQSMMLNFTPRERNFKLLLQEMGMCEILFPKNKSELVPIFRMCA